MSLFFFYRKRKMGDERLKSRWEFIGRIADDEVRKLYLGKKIKMGRSYGTPFIRSSLFKRVFDEVLSSLGISAPITATLLLDKSSSSVKNLP